MNNSFSAEELTNMQLPMLPKTRQAIEIKAKNDGWQFQFVKSNGRNGQKKLFLLSGMPQEVQEAIKEQQIANMLKESKPAPLPSTAKKKNPVVRKQLKQMGLQIDDTVNGLTEKQRDIAHARMSIIVEVNKMMDIGGMALKPAAQYVIHQINSGLVTEHLLHMVEIANARSSKKRTVGLSSLMAWTKAFNAAKSANERLAVLAPMPTKKEIPLVAYSNWLPDFLNHWAKKSSPTLAYAYRKFVEQWEKDGKSIDELPTIDVVRGVYQKMPIVMRERGRVTGSEYKALLPFVRRDWLALNPNDVWIGDGHSFKAKVAHPEHGQPFKPEVTVIIDGCRYVVGFSFSLSESTIAVSDALRIGIRHHGLPLMYYSDNGGGQTSKIIDHEITGYCARLGIHHETGLPGNPQGRGIIEGWWDGTLINLAREYETFVGKGMDSGTQNLMYRKLDSAFKAFNQGKELTDEQKRYKAKLPSWKQFIADVTGCINSYNNRPHSSLPKKDDGEHYTPAEYRAMRIEQDAVEITRLADAELENMFMPEEIRKANRGEVRIWNNRYFHLDLTNHHQQDVRIAYDWDDPSHVIVREMSGKFICKAIFDGNVKAAFPISRRDQLKEQRVQNRIDRLEEQAAIARAELLPTIEQQPDFGLLVGNGIPEMGAEMVQKPKLFLFESDREAFENEQRSKSID